MRSSPILLCLTLAAGCAHDFKPHYRAMEPLGSDATAEYVELRGQIDELYDPATEDGQRRIDRLRSYTFLFVPGFLSDGAVRFDLYFRDYIDWLEAREIDHRIVKIESEASSAKNAAAIRESLLLSRRPAILITHSKGGIDTLLALVEDPKVRPKVAAWLAIQSPFRGSPIADQYLSYTAFRGAYDAFLSVLGGSIASLEDLTHAARRAFNSEHATEITEILGEIPTLAFATWIDDAWPWEEDSPFEPYRDFMLKHVGLKNDGLVPTHSASLAGMTLVAIPDVDHLSAIMANPFVQFDRVRAFQASIEMLQSRMNAEPTAP